MAKRYTLTKEDSGNVLKVLVWTVASAVVVGLLSFMGDLPIELQQLWWFPMVNTLLVLAKKFFEDKVE